MPNRFPAPARIMTAACAASFTLAAACSPAEDSEVALPTEAEYEQPEGAEARDGAAIGIDEPAIQGGDLDAPDMPPGADEFEGDVSYSGEDSYSEEDMGKLIKQSGDAPGTSAAN
jgi:hypothetical protein